MTEPDETPGGKSPYKFIYIAIGAFAVTCVGLFAAGSWLGPTVEEGYPLSERATVHSNGTFVMTVDTSNRKAWIPLSLGGGRVRQGLETVDLEVRRYVLRAPGGAADLGDVPLADAQVTKTTEWVTDSLVDGETQNECLSRWYTYSYWTHLLSPKPSTYAVKLPDGGVAYLRFVSYYCKPEGSGCMTIRYRLERS